MQCIVKGARTVLEVGTFSGMSALAFAEAVPQDGKVVTLEANALNFQAAQAAFDQSANGFKIDLRSGATSFLIKQLKDKGVTFDIIYLNAEKEYFIEYYELALDGLLNKDGII